MRMQRTVPPTAAPVKAADLLRGLSGFLFANTLYRKRLEQSVKDHFGVRDAFFLSSGKAALALILLALGDLTKKTRVVIPAYTCFSVPSSIAKVGLEIVPCDVDAETFDFDYDELKRKVTDATLCVVATHLFGIPANIERLREVCRGKDVFLVEDAAQAMDGDYKGTKLGTLGDVGFFSLGRGKNITCGAGGIIVTDNAQIASALGRHYAELKDSFLGEDLRNFLEVSLMSLFIRPSLYWIPAAMPFLKLGQTFYYTDFPIRTLSSRRAALLWNWRDRLTEANSMRAQNASEISGGITKANASSRYLPYLRFPFLAPDRQTRDSIHAGSQAAGLGISLMYPTPVHEIEELKSAFSRDGFPGATRIAETLLTLPTHHLLNAKDKEAIVDFLAGALLAANNPAAFAASQPI